MPDSTGALISQIANPPNPFDNLGKMTNALTQARQFQADQAVANAYQQSVDPTTGVFDQSKFNALASQGPGSWNFGKTMQEAGQGFGAQGQGTQQDLQARLQQQQTALAYMTPLYQNVINGKRVTGADVNNALDSIPPGVLPGPMINNIRQKATAIGDGDASGMVLGGYYATQHGIDIMNQAGPQAVGVATGGGTQYVPSNARYPGGVGRGNVYIPSTLTPGEAAGLDDVIDSDGVHHQIPHAEAAGILGHPVPGGPPNIVYQTNNGPVAPAPATPSTGTPSVSGPNTPPTPTGRIQPPAPTTPQQPPAGATPPPATGSAPAAPAPPPAGQPTGATLGTGPAPGAVASMEASANAYNAFRADMPASQNRVFTMQQARTALQGAKTGPGTETASTILGVLGTWAPDFVQSVTGLDAKGLATHRDEANKYLQQVANASAGGIGGPATNDKLAAAVTANPSLHVQDLAADQVLGVMIGQERMKQFLWKQAQAQNVQPKDFANWSANWATTHDPRAFIVDQLGPTQLKALQNSLIKNGKATPEGVNFANTVKEMNANGNPPAAAPPPGQD